MPFLPFAKKRVPPASGTEGNVTDDRPGPSQRLRDKLSFPKLGDRKAGKKKETKEEAAREEAAREEAAKEEAAKKEAAKKEAAKKEAAKEEAEKEEAAKKEAEKEEAAKKEAAKEAAAGEKGAGEKGTTPERTPSPPAINTEDDNGQPGKVDEVKVKEEAMVGTVTPDNNARQAESSKHVKGGWTGTAAGGTRLMLDVAKSVAEAFSPLKAVLETISTAHDRYVDTVAVRHRVGKSQSRVVELEELFSFTVGDAQETDRQKKVTSTLLEAAEELRLLHEKSTLRRVVDSSGDDEAVTGILESLDESLHDYMMLQQMAIYEQGRKGMAADDSSILDRIPRAKSPGTGFRGDRKGCFAGTREAIREEIEQWMKNPGEHLVFWLTGLVGTGKTAIAQTIAERAFVTGLLGASFFCSRDFEDRRDSRLILPTLAYQLALKYKEYRLRLLDLIRLDPEVVSDSLPNQMEKFIVKPLVDSDISTVIVIDALDECRDEEFTSAILSVIGQSIHKIPKVKFFLTSRPALRISATFRLSSMENFTRKFVLHDEEQDEPVKKDIRLFFERKLSEISRNHQIPPGWPEQAAFDRLCERAGPLFISAAASIKYLQHLDPQVRLTRLTGFNAGTKHEGKAKLGLETTLDSLYLSILQDAYDGEDELGNVRSVLGAVAIAENPLSPSAIGPIFGLDTKNVISLLSVVQSLLILHENADHPVQPFHPSFPDFLTDSKRCHPDTGFHVSTQNRQIEFLVKCFGLMNSRLKRNICSLQPAANNPEDEDIRETIKKRIGPALEYTCKSWYKHLQAFDSNCLNNDQKSKIVQALRQFLEREFLFWLEVLGLLGATRDAIYALETTVKWLKKNPTADTLALLRIAGECFRFVTEFSDIIDKSSMHIYHSALLLVPKSSVIWESYCQYALPITNIVDGPQSSWDSSISTAEQSAKIATATWSPGGAYIATTLEDSTTIAILDPVSLARYYTMDCPSKGTKVAAFSPDDRLLSCCGSSTSPSSNSFLAIWDTHTGGNIGTWEYTTPSIGDPSSITHSTDGRTIGVTFANQPPLETFTTICVYGVDSGDLIWQYSPDKPFVKLWTHDQSFRFATAEPGNISVWEVEQNIPDPRLHLINTLATPAGWSPFKPSNFSPTLYRLACITQDGVLIWDTQNNKLLFKAQDASFCGTMSFSSNGRFFACGTTGSDIYVWEESSTGYTLHRKFAFCALSPVPLFSPDETSIIAWSSSTIRLWQFSTLTPYNPPHTNAPLPEHFLLDLSPRRGSVVVARRKSNTVEVFNLKTSVQRLTIDAGMKVYGLRIFGDTVVVEGSYEFVTWKLPEGESVFGIALSAKDSVSTIAFEMMRSMELQSTSISPDLLQVATRGADFGVSQAPQLFIYDVPTGGVLAKIPMPGDMVWFSQDGNQVWCDGGAGEEEGWQVVKSDGSMKVSLDPLPIGNPPEEYPWRSSRGYAVTDDGWVLSFEGKRLFWLPPDWRSQEKGTRVWSGQYLVLLHNTLPKPVILKLAPGN